MSALVPLSQIRFDHCFEYLDPTSGKVVTMQVSSRAVRNPDPDAPHKQTITNADGHIAARQWYQDLEHTSGPSQRLLCRSDTPTYISPDTLVLPKDLKKKMKNS